MSSHGHVVRRGIVHLLGVLLLASAPGEIRGQAAGKELTLSAALSLARTENPGLQAEENDIVVSDANLRAAVRDALLPTVNTSSTLTYSASGVRRAGSVVLAEQPSIYSSSYGASLGYNLSASRLMQPRLLRAERQATLSRIASSEAQLQRDVASRYVAVLQAERAVAQAERELARSSDFHKLSRVREALGAASALDVKRAEVQLAQGEVKLARALGDVQSERSSLARTLGTPVGSDVRLTTTFALFEPPWTAEILIDLALKHSASLASKRTAGQTATMRERTARMSYLPSVSMNVSAAGWAQRSGSVDAAIAQRMSNSTDSAVAAKVRSQVLADYHGFPFNYSRQPLSASLTVSLPLLPGWSRESQLAQTRAAVADAAFAIRSEEWRLRTEVENAHRALVSAFRLAQLQGVVRDKASDEVRLVLDRARVGAAGGIAVADAQSQLGQAELDEVNATFAFHRQLLDLELLVGLPFGALRARTGQ